MNSIEDRVLSLYNKFRKYNDINYNQIPAIILNELETSFINNEDLEERAIKKLMEIYKDNLDVTEYLINI